MQSLLELAQELTKNIRAQQAKSEREVEYYRGAADGIMLLLEKADEQAREKTSQDSSTPLESPTEAE